MQILARFLCICRCAANTFFTRCKYQSKLYIVLVSCVFAAVQRIHFSLAVNIKVNFILYSFLVYLQKFGYLRSRNACYFIVFAGAPL